MSDRAEDSSWELQEGDALAPGRTILRRLGGGKHYEAYLVFEERLHAIAVAKVVRPGRLEREAERGEMAAEAEMLAGLNHPGIIRCFGVEAEAERPHLLLEHVEGPRLSSLYRRYGPLATEQLLPLGVQLGAALHYLGEEGVVHLDVKPSNIIMGGIPRLIDFSVAMSVAEAAELRHRVGTDHYMAPEQCDPVELGPVGPPADVWGLAVTLQRAGTGARPFDDPDSDAGEIEDRYPQLADPPRPAEGIPAPLARLLERCLAYEPDERPAPAELADAFESMVGKPPRVRVRRR